MQRARAQTPVCDELGWEPVVRLQEDLNIREREREWAVHRSKNKKINVDVDIVAVVAAGEIPALVTTNYGYELWTCFLMLAGYKHFWYLFLFCSVAFMHLEPI